MSSSQPNVALIRGPLGAGNTINQPLGLMVLAAVLRAEGATCRIVDCEPYRYKAKDVLRLMREFQPDIVLFTAMTVDMPNVRLLSSLLRAEFPDAWIWVGGAHPSGDPQGCLEALPDVDILIKGEGEDTAQELYRRYAGDSREVSGIRGTWYREPEGAVVGNPDRPFETDLDRLPMPAYDLIEPRVYNYRVRRMGALYQHPNYMSLFTSRACPYQCGYCHSIFGKKFVAQSPERVLAEMEHLIDRYRVREFAILDDIFNLDKPRLIAICEGILRKGWKISISFPNGIRGDQFDREALTYLRRAGGWRLNFAPESASWRIQKLIKKHVDLDRIQESIAIASELNFLCHGYFMLGFPTETFEEMKSTVDWAKKSRLHTANYFRVIPLAGTALSRQVRDETKEAVADFSQHDVNLTNINLSEVPAEKIDALRKSAYRSFHGDIRRMIRLARVLPKHPALLPLYLHDAWYRLGEGVMKTTEHNVTSLG